MGVAREFLADPLEIEQIAAVPIEEMIVAMLAPDEPQGRGAVDGRHRGPVARIARGQPFHQGHRLRVGVQILSDGGRSRSDPAPCRAMLDFPQELLAAAQGGEQQARADQTDAADEDSALG